jgi:NAD(P)-dependent dehydrogenase (short-subunit alcohol dehydrogenase family)
MDLQLRDKVVLITGGTDGLGLALAGRLVDEGARVAVCGRDRGRVDAAQQVIGARSLATRGGTEEADDAVLAMVVDVTDAGAVAGFVATAVDRWGRIDGLVNNAGTSAGAPVADLTDEDWTADLDLKLVAAARAVRLALPHLRASGAASIVNTLAIAARTPMANSMPSAASRAAGMAMTKALSRELGPDGIRVNAVLIGLVESGQWRRRAEAAGRPAAEFGADLAKGMQVPLGRIGRADEFADLATYLLSPRSSYVTGTAINLDGGASPAL